MAPGEHEAEFSDWMSQLPAELHDVPLWNLALPGSHDSMSYDLDVDSPIIEPDDLKKCKLVCVRAVVRRWATVQEESIVKQLDAGVRYFDLRIVRKPGDSHPTRLYFYHGLCTHTDVETVLKLFNEWAEQHPKEILVLALSHFKNLDQHLHTHLLTFIRSLFGSKLFYRKDIPTLSSCWKNGRNIIVSYDFPAYQYPEIWSGITYYYGDTMDPEKVKSTLTDVLEKRTPSKSFFVCGLNLTLPEDKSVLKYVIQFWSSLADITRKNLPELVDWVKEQAGKTHVNIVASDLVTCADFVSAVVELNTKQ